MESPSSERGCRRIPAVEKYGLRGAGIKHRARYEYSLRISMFQQYTFVGAASIRLTGSTHAQAFIPAAHVRAGPPGDSVYRADGEERRPDTSQHPRRRQD